MKSYTFEEFKRFARSKKKKREEDLKSTQVIMSLSKKHVLTL